MAEEFNKKILFDNIAFLVKEQGKKIGEVETAAGVSPGYISRSNKDGGAKPGIDFIVNIAAELKISIDTLLKVDLSVLSPTEHYLITFMERLNKQTDKGELDWNRQSAEVLNRMETDMNGNAWHPLFSYETFTEETGEYDSEEVSRVVMTSHSYDFHTYIAGDCFSLGMKNKSTLYFMNISKSVFQKNDPTAYAKEIWLYQSGTGCHFLCSTLSNSTLAPIIEKTYATITEYYQHPQIQSDVRTVIDAFMKGDLGQNDDSGLPF